MVIGKRKQIFSILIILLTFFVLTGCSLIEDEINKIVIKNGNSEIVCNNDVDIYEDKNIYYNEFDFYGVWRLEEVIINRQNEGIFYADRISPSVIMVDIESFIGYELEFTSEFVRLGDRKLFAPEYLFLASRRVDINLLATVVEPNLGYFNSSEKLANAFHEIGVELRYDGENYNIALNTIRIRYPEYPEVWWLGILLDPELYMYNIGFNPIFGQISILNVNYILVGSSEVEILARRIK